MSKTTPAQNKALILEAFDLLCKARLCRCGRLLVGPLHPAQRQHITRTTAYSTVLLAKMP